MAQKKPTYFFRQNGLHQDMCNPSDASSLIINLSLTPLCTRLSFMRQGHNTNARRYQQIQEDLEASKKAIQVLEGSSVEAADKYRFLQEMRGYVGDLLECLSEKVRMNAFAFTLLLFVVFLYFFFHCTCY